MVSRENKRKTLVNNRRIGVLKMLEVALLPKMLFMRSLIVSKDQNCIKVRV
jgi:hypothetical protein